MSKKKTVIVMFNETMLEKLEELQEYLGFESRSDTIRYAVSFALKKNIPEYARTVTAPPEVKAEARVKLKEEKQRRVKERETNRQADLVRQLDAEVHKDDPSMCTYYTYQYVNDNIPPYKGKRVIAVADLTEDLVEAQYKGATKEEILAVIKKNK